MQPETKFKIALRKELDLIPKSYFEKIQQVGLRGTPDILGVINGHAVALELKVEARIEAIQSYKLNKWAKAGAKTFVVTPKNKDQVLKDLILLAGDKL